MTQAPETHVSVALVWLHFSPHPPQLLASPPVLTSQPLAGLLSQLE